MVFGPTGERFAVLKIHTNDGKTHRVDLADEQQAKVWLQKLKRRDTQEAITGISVVQECRGRIRCPSCKRAGFLHCQSCDTVLSSDATTKTGIQYSLSKPDGYGDVFYAVNHIDSAEGSKVRGGDRIACFAGDSRITMMVHKGQPSVRVTLLRTGKQRYNPFIGD